MGVRAEVAKTPTSTLTNSLDPVSNGGGEDVDIDMDGANVKRAGKASWINLSLTLPGLRDDDKDLVFLEEMLREVLVLPSSAGAVDETTTTRSTKARSLQDALVINSHWHWRLYIDVVLISPPNTAAGSYPLPLLSMAVHLALRDTRIPRLKSEGEEDPLADDDWEASVHLYGKSIDSRSLAAGIPPVTLLVMVVGENVIFDPDGTELAVADGVFAVSIGRNGSGSGKDVNVLAVRMLETSARDTFKGIPRNENGNSWETVPGVWRPKVGGVKRAVMSNVVDAVLGDAGREVLNGLEGFVVQGG